MFGKLFGRYFCKEFFFSLLKFFRFLLSFFEFSVSYEFVFFFF